MRYSLHKCRHKSLFLLTVLNMVPMAGVEPAQLAPHAPQACVSTNFTTSAYITLLIFTGVQAPAFTSLLSAASPISYRHDTVWQYLPTHPVPT